MCFGKTIPQKLHLTLLIIEEQAGAELSQAQGKIFLDYHSIGEPPPPA